MVAMSGAIMPDPLMMPTRFTVRPPTTACATAAFGKVSVVMIVAAASSQPHGGAAKAASNPASALSMGRGTPITPVEETNTSEGWRSEEHTSELQSLMRISYAVFCLKKKNKTKQEKPTSHHIHT